MTLARLPPRISKGAFVRRIADAVQAGRGFAAGKIGGSEKYLLYHPIARARHGDQLQRRTLDALLGFHGETQAGIFPRRQEFYEVFIDFYADRLRQLDALGLFAWPNEPAIVHHYRLDVALMDFIDQEPDRSVPDNPHACYLKLFEGRRLLLVSPFARTLAERANAATFEAVWAKTGKRWFNPSQVDSLAVPYGWSGAVQDRYGTSLALLDHLAEQMSGKAFDLALIGAGGLGVPLAVAAKRQGAVGISLGGHLQVVFGLLGKRWREREDWQRDYINDAWIDVPDAYRPTEKVLVDDGAYW